MYSIDLVAYFSVFLWGREFFLKKLSKPKQWLQMRQNKQFSNVYEVKKHNESRKSQKNCNNRKRESITLKLNDLI